MPGGIQGESLLPAHASLAYSSTPAPWRLGLQKPWKLLLPKNINSSVFIYAMWGRKQDFLQNLPWFYNSCSVNKQKKIKLNPTCSAWDDNHHSLMLAWILAHNTQPTYDPVLQHPCASYRLLDLMRQPLKKKGCLHYPGVVFQRLLIQDLYMKEGGDKEERGGIW